MPESWAGETRGRLLTLLCGADLTAGALAERLGISANAVRGHLGQLRDEGMVAHRVVRRGVGKPAHEYFLTDLGSARLSRAYLPLLSGVLEAAREKGGEAEEAALLHRAGRAVARRFPRPEGTLRERADAAARILAGLGAVSTVQEEGGVLWIRGGCCPLRALVPDRPLACGAVEALLAELIGVPVREDCAKDDAPSCRMRVGKAG